MAVVKQLMIRAGADFSGLVKESKKASDAFGQMESKISKSMSKIRSVMGALGVGLSIAGIVSAAKDAAQAYDQQAEAETRLAQVMRNTMGATSDEIKKIKELTAAQQQLGVVGDEIQLQGAQELATYLGETKSLEKLIPVMNDMVAQQYGYNATAENAVNIATMLGKVMEGQTGALSRYGYYFDDAQKKILQYGTEEQRVAVLAEIVEGSVGGMNQALAQTPTGRMKQLANTMSDIKESFGMAVRTLGTAFLPVLNKVAGILADVATLANKVAQAIANVFGGKSSNKKYSYAAPAAAAENVGDLADSYGDVAKNAKAAEKAQKNALSVLDIDTLHLFSMKDTSSGGGDSGDTAPSDSGGSPSSGIQEMIDESDEASESVGWLEEALQKLKDLWGELDFGPLKEAWNGLKEALDPLIDKIKNGLGWCWENILKPLAHWTIEEAAPAAVRLLSAAFEALNAVLDKLSPLFKALWENILKPFAQWLGDNFIEMIEDITRRIQAFADMVSGKISFREWIEQMDLFGKAVGLLGVALAAVKIEEFGMKVVAAGKAIGAVFAASAVQTAAASANFMGAAGAAGSMVPQLTGATAASTGLGAAFTAAVPIIGGLAVATGVAVTQFNNEVDALVGVNTTSEQARAKTEQLTAQYYSLEAQEQALAASGGDLTDVQNQQNAVRVALNKVTDQYCDLCRQEGNLIDANVTSHAKLITEVEDSAGAYTSLKDTAKQAANDLKADWGRMSDWWKTSVSEPLKKSASECWEGIKEGARQGAENFKQSWQQTGQWFKSNVVEPIKRGFQEAWEGVKSGAQSAWQGLQSAWQGAGSWFQSNVAEKIKSGLNQAWNGIKSGAQQAWQGIQSAFGNVSGFFQQVGSSAANAFGSAIKSIVSTVQSVVASVKSALSGIGSAIESAKSSASSALSSITSSISSIGSGIRSTVSSVVNRVTGSSYSIPRLASGAVIPPNSSFAAILGDQTHGYNIETPEALLRQIFREETGTGNEDTTDLLRDILRAVRAGKILQFDGKEVGSVLGASLSDRARAVGTA